jgi:hypothetical protein
MLEHAFKLTPDPQTKAQGTPQQGLEALIRYRHNHLDLPASVSIHLLRYHIHHHRV